MENEEDASSSSSNENLNLSSEKFDPVKCLYSKKVLLPNRNAPLFDNLSKFTVNENNEVEVKQTIVKPPAKPIPLDRKEIKSTLVDRKLRVRKNLLTKLDRIEKGPLFALKSCMLQKIYVKVFTRNHSSIKGYCTGIIVAFDKHWNIALKDVHEIWTRPKKKLKSIYMDTPETKYQVRHRPNIPHVRTLLIHKKGEQTLERRMDQILIRGEHVVSVCALNYRDL